MKISEYFKSKKKLQNLLLSYIDSCDNIEEDQNNLFDYFCSQKIGESKKELEIVLTLIKEITKNHFKLPGFYNKIEKIFMFFIDDIKNFYTPTEIVYFFKRCKKIVLFFFKEKIITPDEYSQMKTVKFYDYFYPEIELISNINLKKINEKYFEENPKLLDNFEEKRQLGQNESYLSHLIRNDSVEDFVTYITQTSTSLNTTIERSIFETNDFLLYKQPSLIEYSAFFGSVQIFQYLRLNGVALEPSLWLYVIHGRNPELIHLLEENDIKPPDSSYKACFKEAVKCHHNEIANYFKENFLQINEDEELDLRLLGQSVFYPAFHYYNYEFFPSNLSYTNVFYYVIKYNYFDIFHYLYSSFSENESFDINQVFKNYVFFRVFLPHSK